MHSTSSPSGKLADVLCRCAPCCLQGGDLVEVSDTWVDRSHPASLMASAAFTKV